MRNLILDRASGKLSKAKAATIAAAMFRKTTRGTAEQVPGRYVGAKAGIDDLLALSALSGQAGRERITSAPLPRAAQPTCDVITGECQVRSDNFVFAYYPGDSSLDLSDVNPANGVPDRAEKTLDVLEDARRYFAEELALTAPGGLVYVYWNHPLVMLVTRRAASLPGNVIYLFDNYEVDYLPVHELAHQFQWPYIMFALGADPIGNSRAFNWWMEATAEWATKQYAVRILGQPSTISRAPEAARIPEFFATPSSRLSSGDYMTQTSRHYGAIAAVEFFTQQFGDDFVRKTYLSVQGMPTLDEFYHLDATFQQYYWGTTAEWLPWMWDSLYTMCDPAHPIGQLQGSSVGAWCSQHVRNNMVLTTASPPMGSLGRPHHGTSSEASGTAAVDIGAGGAYYHDLALPYSSATSQLHIELGASNASNLAVVVSPWSTSPGAYCLGGVYEPPSTLHADQIELTAQLSSGCTNATIMVVNTGTWVYSPPTSDLDDVTLRWAAYDSGAIISNGTIALGVSPYGNLEGQPTVEDGDTTVTLNYAPTGLNALRIGSDDDCWQVEQRGASDPAVYGGHFCNQETEANLYVDVVSFEHTPSEATSIVRVGSVEVVHYYHPSAHANAYQLDISIRTNATTPLPGDMGTIAYRRIMDVDVEWAGQPLPSYVAMAHDPAQTDVNGYTNRTDPWSIDLLSTPLQPADISLFEPGETAHQGMAIDLDIWPQNPHTTLYYGAAPAATATQVLNSLPVRTYGLATPPLEENNNPMITFFLAH